MTEQEPHKPGTSRHRIRTPRPGTKRAGGTKVRHLPTKTPARGTRTISSSDDDQQTQLQRRVAAGPTLKGLSLRWKIVIALASVVGVTAVLIFVVVYNKAVTQLNNEINAKGERLVSLLASIDDDYWYTVIHSGEGLRKEDFNTLLENLGARKNWRDLLKKKGLGDIYERAISPFGVKRKDEIETLINQLTGDEKWKRLLEDNYLLMRQYEDIVNPIAGLSQLKPLVGLAEEAGEDLLDAGVVDVTDGDRNAPAIQITGRQNVSLPKAKAGERMMRTEGKYEGAKVITRARTFILNPPKDAKRPIRFYVSLSLATIERAKSQMFTAIFLPILLTGLIGIGIAIWVSSLITNPLKVLMSDINAVSQGDLDHQTVATSRDEIGQLADTFNTMTQALKTAHENELEAKALEHELDIANEIQSNLLPKKMLKIPNYDVGAYYRPSKEVGGDYYDFIKIGEDNIGFIVADVSGKGVPGSLVMSMARAFIRMEADRSRNISAKDTLIRANRMLAQDIKKGMFVTAIYCILNIKTGDLRVASAGHNPLVLYRAADKKIYLVNPSGIALGFDKGPVFERTIKEETLKMAPGDRITLYTDGIVEAMDAQNEEFGDDKFRQLCLQLTARPSNEFINVIVRKLEEHQGDAPQHDDMSMITVRAT